jgi:hypothetical protein
VKVPGGVKEDVIRTVQENARTLKFGSHGFELTEPSEGQILDQFRRPWADGSTAWRLTPLERLERLTALVPAPRTHVLDQLLAPHAAWRAAIVLEPAAGAPGPSPPPVLRCVPVLQATRGLEKDRS